jgi:hypothetical protein
VGARRASSAAPGSRRGGAEQRQPVGAAAVRAAAERDRARDLARIAAVVAAAGVDTDPATLLTRTAAAGPAHDLGRRGFGVAGFVAGILDGDAAAGRGLCAPAMANALDDYVEAHVHGTVRLDGDVEALVADPAFSGTPTGDLLAAAARRHGFAPAWNAGLVLRLARVPREAPDHAHWRWQVLCAGGRAHRLAARVVTAFGSAGHLDAAAIGAAAADAVRAPGRWREWAAPAEVSTHLKDLWLMLVALGAPPP